jgi:acyl carrier protein
MGLDIVEYVMAVEQEFEIVFDDADLERIRSVGEFHQLVLREIRTKHPPVNVERARRAVCVSSRGFYHLRKALTQCGFATRKEIAPKTALESIIPKENRRVRWNELADVMKCVLPRLVRTKAVCWTFFACSTLLVLCPIGLGFMQSASAIELWLALSIPALCILSFELSQPLAVEFQRWHQTVGNLTEWLVANNWRHFAEPDREWTDREVWDTICRLLVERQGLDPAQITPDATFVDDLRMD